MRMMVGERAGYCSGIVESHPKRKDCHSVLCPSLSLSWVTPSLGIHLHEPLLR
jgi:hypothetical protein